MIFFFCSELVSFDSHRIIAPKYCRDFVCLKQGIAATWEALCRNQTYLNLLSLLEESLLTSLLLGLLGGEVLGLSDLLDLLGVEAGDIDLLGGGDDVSGVDSSQRDTVDLEGAGDEEDTLVEGLEEDDTLAAEAAGEEDQDGTGLEGLAGSPRADGLADLLF